LSFADRGLRLGRELDDDLAVQVLPDVRHKEELAALAKKLPVGRLYSNGKGCREADRPLPVSEQ
jgi:hypothetical protein